MKTPHITCRRLLRISGFLFTILLWTPGFAENSAAASAGAGKDEKPAAVITEDEQGEQVVDLYKSMPKTIAQQTTTVSGVVVAVRASPQTEVFLRGARSSVIIPNGRQHNSFLNKAVQSQKSGTEVSFTVDAKTMRIIDEDVNSTTPKSGQ